MLDRYYGFVDAEIGRAIRDQAPGDLLLVVSGYAVERAPLAERLVARLLRRPGAVRARPQRRRTGF